MRPVVPSMSDRDGKIWMDGQMVEWRDARIHVLTHTLYYGSAAEVAPSREMDRLEIGAGRRGPITEKIQNACFDIVNGRNFKYAHGLTRV